MVKTINIGEKEITLSNNLSWAMIYKNQFGHDIVPDIMPIISAIMKSIGEFAKHEGEDVSDVITKLDPDVVQDALLELCALQFTDFINLTWALAKANDPDIKPPMEWVKQFDEFPLDIVAPAVGELVIKGMVSTKNLQSLRGILPRA